MYAVLRRVDWPHLVVGVLLSALISSSLYTERTLATSQSASAAVHWVATGGPAGPITALLAVGGRLYAGGNDRVVMSTNGGVAWQSIDSQPPAGNVQALLASGESASSSLLAGTSLGLYRSTDAGHHWTAVSYSGKTGTLPTTRLLRVGNVLYAGTGQVSSVTGYNGQGLFASQDAGRTWHPVALPKNAGVYISALATSTRGLLVATMTAGLQSASALWIRSGSTFHSLGNLSASLEINALVAAPTALLLGTTGGIYRLLNGATTVSRVTQGKTQPYIYTLVADPTQASTLYAGTLGSGDPSIGAGFYRSDNGGATWRPANHGMAIYQDVRAIAAQPTGTGVTLDVGTDGIFRSTDRGATWTSSIASLDASPIRALAIDPQRPSLLVAGVYYSGFYRTTDAAHNTGWTNINTGLFNNFPINLAFSPAGTLYAATDSAVVRLNTSDVTSAAPTGWQHIDQGLNLPQGAQVSAFAVGTDSTGQDVLYVSGSFGLSTSPDGGSTWSAITAPITNAITLLATSMANPSVVYAASGSKVYVSTTRGASWSVTGPQLTSTMAVTALAVDDADAQIAYMALSTLGGTGSGILNAQVYRTTNGGTSWHNVRTYGAGTVVETIKTEPSLIISAVQIGTQHVQGIVDVARPGATLSWQALGAALPSGIWAPTVAESATGAIYLGTSVQGVWKTSTSTSGIPGPVSTPLPPAPTPTPVLGL